MSLSLTVAAGDPAPLDRAALEQALIDRLALLGKLDAQGAERAGRLARSAGETLEHALLRLGLVAESDIVDGLAATLGIEAVRKSDFPDEPVLQDVISVKFLREADILPLAVEAGALRIAMADPTDLYARQSLEMAAGMPVEVRLAAASDIRAAFERLYGAQRSAMHEIVDQEPGEDEPEDVGRLKDLASEAPVVKLVNLLIARAVEARASDIHLEPFEERLAVRYRIDGLLREVESPPARLRAAVTSRIKLMAKLNIAERRLPQDGRIRLAVGGQDIDLRVSTAPTLHGESVVLRVLDRDRLVLDFAGLGFGGAALPPLLDILARPHGIVLVTGPTGSGKTTTLYAALQHLNAPERKVITVEDPVEYQLDGVNQIQVKPQIGLNFAQVLRSILRQDPDIIMVGEIRDLETAEIAVQAALTGHLVLSTLHTNDAVSTITRLLDMGVADYLLTSTINAVVAQRLVRKLCPRCRESFAPLPELAERLAPVIGAPVPLLYRPKGCEACGRGGYIGRTSINELLPMTEEVHRAILGDAGAAEIARAARAAGMRSMYADGVAKAASGETTLEEVLRVTREGAA